MHLYLKIAFATAFVLITEPLVAQMLVPAQPETVGMSSERLERLTESLQDYVHDNQLAGAVALVVRRGKIAYLEAVGFRDKETDAPMLTDTIFRIASQTKALVSVGVMILQEDGDLLITDAVGKYLPEFMHTTVAEPNDRESYSVVAANRPITIQDLLTHTAGISYGSGPASQEWEEAAITGWYFANRSESVREVMNRLAELPFDAHPGEQWIYGYNTDILGVLIEQISGQTLADFLNKRLFQPLQLQDSHFFLPPEKVDRLATVYSSTADGSVDRAPGPGHKAAIPNYGYRCVECANQGSYINGPRKSFSGGAGLLSTATDYATFLQMLLNGGALQGKQILTRKTVELMTVDHTGDIAYQPGQGFGLGFSIMQDPAATGLPSSVGEYGWGGAYHSTYWVDPAEELIVVYMTQLIPAIDIDDHGKLRTLVYQSIID